MKINTVAININCTEKYSTPNLSVCNLFSLVFSLDLDEMVVWYFTTRQH